LNIFINIKEEAKSRKIDEEGSSPASSHAKRVAGSTSPAAAPLKAKKVATNKNNSKK
jgi:hypothetical protein